MKTFALVAAALVAVTFGARSAEACEEHRKEASAVKKISVQELAAFQKENKAVVLDANNPETRSKYGVIPGAKLLTSSSKYELSELPTDKAQKLVFYCANQKCTASHKAAQKASGAGYTDVNILPEGIAGWKDAGQPVSKPQS